jgi:hypothetical protein
MPPSKAILIGSFVIANSIIAAALVLPKATPKQLEAERKARRQARREERNDVLDRFMSFFERIIKFAQKHAGEAKPPPEDERFKQL